MDEIKVILADGTELYFPLGTDDAIIDAKVKEVVSGQSQDPAATENIAQNSSVAPNPVFDPSGQNMINNVTGPEETYGSLFT